MRSSLKVLLMSILLVVAVPAMAMQSTDGSQNSSGASKASDVSDLGKFQSGGMSLSQAVEMVRRKYGGRIVSAETVVKGNREEHVIKVLTQDGKVKTERVPGRQRN